MASHWRCCNDHVSFQKGRCYDGEKGPERIRGPERVLDIGSSMAIQSKERVDRSGRPAGPDGRSRGGGGRQVEFEWAGGTTLPAGLKPQTGVTMCEVKRERLRRGEHGVIGRGRVGGFEILRRTE